MAARWVWLCSTVRWARLGAERLWLNESGDPVLDTVYVEHNGMLLTHAAADLLPACLRAMLAAPIAPARRGGGPWGRRLRLAGVDAAHLAAAQQIGAVHLLNETVAPFVDLASLPPEPEGYLASLSANTRYQIRRSNRCFDRLGPLVARQAETEAEALAFLDSLARCVGDLEQTGIARRLCQPSVPALPPRPDQRVLPRGELVLLRFSVGGHVLGYLYNIRCAAACSPTNPALTMPDVRPLSARMPSQA